MKKMTLMLVTCICLMGLSGCQQKQINTITDRTNEEDSSSEIVNNYAGSAQENLEYIGENLTNRDCLTIDKDKDNDHQATIDWIVTEIKKAGYTDNQISYQTLEGEYEGKVYKGKNIILTVEGTDTSKQIVAGTHYDGDGVGDNGSGIALLLSAACGLADQKPLYTIKYVFFDLEEIGLYGSFHYANSMTEEEIRSTVYMINIDALAFGDYCNLYGGVQDYDKQEVTQTEAFDLAMAKAAYFGFNLYDTKYLDGYFAKNGKAPELDVNGLFTNPWTYENPAPINEWAVSPTTIDASDHVGFAAIGIPYVYMEATNWFAKGADENYAYTGYPDTADETLGESGMFMNTEYDTIENLNKFYPGRSLEHFNLYSPILCSLLMNPASEMPLSE